MICAFCHKPITENEAIQWGDALFHSDCEKMFVKENDTCWCGREIDKRLDYDEDPPPRYCTEHKCRCGNGTPAKPEDRFFQPHAGIVAHVPGNECTTKCDGMACCYGCGTCYCECHD